MATIFRHEDVDFKENTDMIDHYRLFTSSPQFSSVVNSRNLNFDLRLLNPGQFSFPYHFHRFAEELIMIISGTMTMRSLKDSTVDYFKGEDKPLEKWEALKRKQ
jgi:uncharacterized cupin superfamily protein